MTGREWDRKRRVGVRKERGGDGERRRRESQSTVRALYTGRYAKHF